jgi:hypothetical protein
VLNKSEVENEIEFEGGPASNWRRSVAGVTGDGENERAA